VKAHHLICGEHISHFGAKARFEPDLFALCRCQFFGSSAHGSFFKALVHNRVVERLSSLTNATTGSNPLIVMAKMNLSYTGMLVRRETYSLHNHLLKSFLFLVLIKSGLIYTSLIAWKLISAPLGLRIEPACAVNSSLAVRVRPDLRADIN
jgi:hypothetical protein